MIDSRALIGGNREKENPPLQKNNQLAVYGIKQNQDFSPSRINGGTSPHSFTPEMAVSKESRTGI